MTSEASPLSNMIFAPGSEGIYYKVPSSQKNTLIVLYCVYMDVSKNRGTPKWMVKIMENPIKMDETPIYCRVRLEFRDFSHEGRFLTVSGCFATSEGQFDSATNHLGWQQNPYKS